MPLLLQINICPVDFSTVGAYFAETRLALRVFRGEPYTCKAGNRRSQQTGGLWMMWVM
jgi:hypothetical protein